MGNKIDFYAPDSPAPEPEYVPQFDPMLGFPNGRKERVVRTSIEEMESSAVPPEKRDFCIDTYMKFLACRRKHFPLMYRCKHEVHDYHDCQYEDYILRKKEFERERRLSIIAARKNGEMEE